MLDKVFHIDALDHLLPNLVLLVVSGRIQFVLWETVKDAPFNILVLLLLNKEFRQLAHGDKLRSDLVDLTTGKCMLLTDLLYLLILQHSIC